MEKRTVLEYKGLKHSGGKNADKVRDGEGLFLFITKTKGGESKHWKYLYRSPLDRKQKTLSLGSFPEIMPAKARDLRAAAKKMIGEGIDPQEHRKRLVKEEAVKVEEERKAREVSLNTFEKVAREYIELKRKSWGAKHYKKAIGRYETYIFPIIGDVPIADITKDDTKKIIKDILKRGNGDLVDTAYRIYQKLKCVFEDAYDKDYINRVPIAKRATLLPKYKAKKMPALTDLTELRRFLQSVKSYKGNFVTKCALQLLVYLPIRQGEYRSAQWQEFDLEAATWTIPAQHRKLGLDEKGDPENDLITPLSRQAVAILRGLYSYTGDGKYVFAGQGANANGYMSENTLGKVINEKLGFKGRMTPHGIRSVFSTLLNDMDVDDKKVDKQLGHKQKNEVESRYNRAEYMRQRVKMMQDYADRLDEIRDGAQVIPIHKRTA